MTFLNETSNPTWPNLISHSKPYIVNIFDHIERALQRYWTSVFLSLSKPTGIKVTQVCSQTALLPRNPLCYGVISRIKADFLSSFPSRNFMAQSWTSQFWHRRGEVFREDDIWMLIIDWTRVLREHTILTLDYQCTDESSHCNDAIGRTPQKISGTHNLHCA